MEKRKLVTVGIEGPALESSIPTHGKWFTTASSKGALLLGVRKRGEDDVEQALSIGLSQITPSRRMYIRELNVDFKDNKPSFNWDSAFGTEIRGLQPGEILVHPELAKIYERKFLFEKITENGKDYFFLRGERKRPTRLRGLTPEYSPIIGRKTELEQLQDLVGQSKEDQGQIAGVIGEAGIGKTRLIVALKDFLKEKRVPFVEGSYTPQNPQLYEAFRQIVVGLVGAKIHTLSRWSMTDAETDFLRLFLDPGTKIERLANMTEQEIRQGLFYSVRKLIYTAAKEPLVLIMEDLHWAEDSSIELLKYVLEGIEETKMLLILVHRPDLQVSWSKRLNYNEIRVSPLMEEEIDHFVCTLLKVDAISIQLHNELYQKTQGNPLFIEEILRQMKESDFLDIEQNEARKRYLRIKSNKSSEVPTTINALISVRFDALDEKSKDALRWAAFFGSSFLKDEYLPFLVDQKCSDPEKTLQELIERKYLSEKGVFPKIIYQFSHDLIFEVLRQNLVDTNEKSCLTKIGDFLESIYPTPTPDVMERIAEYLISGKPSAKAILWALKTGDVAMATHRYQRALHFFSQAARASQQLNSRGPSSHDIFARYVQALLTVGDLQKTEEVLQDWVRMGIGNTPEQEGTYYHLKLKFHDSKNESLEALKASERAISDLRRVPQLENELFESIYTRLNTLIQLGRSGEAIHEALKELQQINDRNLPNPKILLWARAAWCVGISGDSEHALHYINNATSLVNEQTPVNIQIELISRTTPILARLGRYRDAITISTNGIEMARDAGMRLQMARAYLYRGIYAEEDGNYILALSDYRESLKEAHEIDHLSTEIRSLIGIWDSYLDIGAVTEAARWEKEHHALLWDERDKWNLGVTNGLYATLMELQGDFKKSLEYRKRSTTIFEEIKHLPSASRAMLYSFMMEVKCGQATIETITEQFNAHSRKGIEASWVDNRYQIFATALMLSAAGGKPAYGLDLDLKPGDCPIAWLRQLVYVAKIKGLDSQKRFEEADGLREEYRKERLKIMERVPPEFHNDFVNHPRYRVPERTN